ncbi:hypothetical protein [Actinacidiphila oryziradicis]|uniref:Uncharacterized protein n=1 Tax=Actinacidiphila oryziradicis TaxID=2571141 RepID=A0A4U0RJN7_9ACTN|nr:hypothetical protein [Actinacidiphila oryziradicis]TJZ94960.1 hypothetical protein FCI23_52720 [Actinacidiphila oryziradicis]
MAGLSEESSASQEPAQLPSTENWALRIIEVVAPEEIPAFRTLAEPYVAARSMGRLRGMRGPGALGSGLDVVAALTPVALLMCDVAKGVLAETAKDAITHRVTKIFRKKALTEAAVPLPLTAERLASARSRALKAAIDAGVEPEKARAMVDALIGSLLDSRD